MNLPGLDPGRTLNGGPDPLPGNRESVDQLLADGPVCVVEGRADEGDVFLDPPTDQGEVRPRLEGNVHPLP